MVTQALMRCHMAVMCTTLPPFFSLMHMYSRPTFRCIRFCVCLAVCKECDWPTDWIELSWQTQRNVCCIYFTTEVFYISINMVQRFKDTNTLNRGRCVLGLSSNATQLSLTHCAATGDRKKSNSKSGAMKSLQTDETASKFRKVKRRKRN